MLKKYNHQTIEHLLELLIFISRNTGIIYFFYINIKPLSRFFQIMPKFPRKIILYNSKYQLRPKILIKRIKARVIRP